MPMPAGKKDEDKSGIQPAAALADSLKSEKFAYPPSMDARLLLVVTPVLLAASWAVFHIGRAAVGQLQLMLKRARA